MVVLLKTRHSGIPSCGISGIQANRVWIPHRVRDDMERRGEGRMEAGITRIDMGMTLKSVLG